MFFVVEAVVEKQLPESCSDLDVGMIVVQRIVLSSKLVEKRLVLRQDRQQRSSIRAYLQVLNKITHTVGNQRPYFHFSSCIWDPFHGSVCK